MSWRQSQRPKPACTPSSRNRRRLSSVGYESGSSTRAASWTGGSTSASKRRGGSWATSRRAIRRTLSHPASSSSASACSRQPIAARVTAATRPSCSRRISSTSTARGGFRRRQRSTTCPCGGCSRASASSTREPCAPSCPALTGERTTRCTPSHARSGLGLGARRRPDRRLHDEIGQPIGLLVGERDDRLGHSLLAPHAEADLPLVLHEVAGDPQGSSAVSEEELCQLAPERSRAPRAEAKSPLDRTSTSSARAHLSLLRSKGTAKKRKRLAFDEVDRLHDPRLADLPSEDGIDHGEPFAVSQLRIDEAPDDLDQTPGCAGE